MCHFHRYVSLSSAFISIILKSVSLIISGLMLFFGMPNINELVEITAKQFVLNYQKI